MRYCVQGTVPGAIGSSERNKILLLSKEDKLSIQIHTIQGRKDQGQQRGRQNAEGFGGGWNTREGFFAKGAFVMGLARWIKFKAWRG